VPLLHISIFLSQPHRPRLQCLVGFLADLNSDQCPFQGDEGLVVVNVFSTARDHFFRALFGSHGAVDIDLVSAFGRLGQKTDLILLNLNESPGYRQERPARSLSVSNLSDLQFRKEWRMPRKDAEVTSRSRNLQFLNFLSDDFALGSNDDEIDRVIGHLFNVGPTGPATIGTPPSGGLMDWLIGPVPPRHFTAAIFSALAKTSSIVPTM
jgi:hypothetical protein